MRSQSQKQKPKQQRILTSEQMCIKNGHFNLLLFEEVLDAFLKFSPTLKRINLQGNKMWLEKKYLSLIFNELIQLNLSKNFIKKIFIKDMPKIKYINISKNMIDQFVVKKQLPALEILYLNENKLTHFPPLVAPNLTQLNLSHNSIQSIKQFSKKQYPSLKILTLVDNHLRQAFPRLKCPKLQNLDISFNCRINSIDKFCQDEYSNIKTLILKGMDWKGYQIERQFFTSLPLLRMPKLQTLVITSAHLRDFNGFAQGDYPELTTFQISFNAIELILPPKLKLPKLRNIILNNNRITNITEFLMGDYPLLEKMQITENSFLLYKGAKFSKQTLKLNKQILNYAPVHQESNQVLLWQMVQSGDKADEFIKIQGFPYQFYKNLLIPYFSNLTKIKINIRTTKSIRLLFQLDIRYIKDIEIEQNHYLTSTYKQITKINLNDPYLNNLKNIGINESENPNILDNYNHYQTDTRNYQVSIERNEYWRRVVSDKKQINWHMKYIVENNKSQSYKIYQGFMKRLFPVRFRLFG